MIIHCWVVKDLRLEQITAGIWIRGGIMKTNIDELRIIRKRSTAV
jgi:hypothetical protein